MSSSLPIELGWKISRKSINIVQNSTVKYNHIVEPLDMNNVKYNNTVLFYAKMSIINQANKVVLVLTSPDNIILMRDINDNLSIDINFSNILLSEGIYKSDLMITNNIDINKQYPLYLNINIISSYSR